MNTTKKLVFACFFTAFLVFLPQNFVSADTGRFFVRSTSAFWKNALGVRHSFDDGFTTELSDFQVRLNRILGPEIEPIKVLHILPSGPADRANPEGSQSKKETPILGITPKTAKGQKPIRPIPSDQTSWGIEIVYNNLNLLKTSGGLDVKVAVLDTGALVSHPDLKARILQCKDFTNPKFSVVEGKCEDKNGHGTHVAGIIAADGGSDGKGIYGMAPEADLMIYKVCGTNGLCYADDIAVALKLAADNGANVANMSFGSDLDIQLIRQAIDYGTIKGMLMMAAAGNDGPFEESIDYPAANSAVVAAGAVNQKLVVVEWSSRGINLTTQPFLVEEKDIEFALPGENIESTWNNGGYVILSGTSMASPFAAGLAAKFWQKTAINPAQATRDILQKMAVDLIPLGDDNESGFGLPQLPSI